MSNNYSLSNMAYAIRRLEQEVQGLVNQQQRPFQPDFYGMDDLDFLKKQFEKLNAMLGLLQTSAQSIVEKGLRFEAWKQGSNVYRNIIQPLAEKFYIGRKLQNGLTRTQFAMDEKGVKYAIQGANTLCGDVYELIVIYRNGLARNVIPNMNLESMWNDLCNILSNVVNLGDSISTQSFTQKVISNGSEIYIENGTIGGFKDYETKLENYCMVMWKLCQSILNKISDVRTGFGSVFGSNHNIAVHQCSLGPGVSLAPFNTCAEIFNTMQSPLTVVSSCGAFPFKGFFGQLNYLTSSFNFSPTDCALVSLFTTWNPFVSDAHTLIGNGIQADESGSAMASTITINPSSLTYCKAFGYGLPSVNRFDVSNTILTYQTNTSTGNYENLGLNIQLYFTASVGVNNSTYTGEALAGSPNEGENYGDVTGKVIINSTGFNFVGFYTNNPTLSVAGATIATSATIGSTPFQMYQLGGRLYYA